MYKNTALAVPAGSTIRAGLAFISGKGVGVKRLSLWPASPEGPTATPISTQKQNSN